MAMFKRTTQQYIFKHKQPSIGGVHPDWEMHPSWIAGIAGLDAYNRWVCEVLMPIAFQWIEEHKADVYQDVPDNLKDDVGVVIASAFQIVETLSSYQNGLKKAKEYEEQVKRGEWDPSTVNPLWSGISKKIREGTERTFGEQSKYLKDTIR